MSQPVYTSLDPLTIAGEILDIGHGNWSAGGGLEPLVQPKWMPVVRVDNDPNLRGITPRMPSVPATTTYPGELSYSERCSVSLHAYADGKEHTVTVSIYVAQFFDGWGDHPEDAWEWGHFRSDDQTTPAVLTKKFTIGDAPPPPPPPDPTVTLESAQTKAIQALYALVEARRALGDSDAKIANTLYYQVIRALSLPVGDGRRAKVKDAIKAAIAG